MPESVVVTTTNYQHLRKVNVVTGLVTGTSLPVWTSVTDDGHNTFETVVATASPVAGLATVVVPNYSGGAPPFSPVTGLTGLIGWWDTSVTASLNLTGAQINSIADQSGAGNNAPWGAYGKPIYNATGFNGRASINFDSAGVGSALRITSFPMGTGNTLTFFYVGTLSSTGTANDARVFSYEPSGFSDWNSSTSWGMLRPGSSTTQMTILRNAAVVSSVNVACSLNVPHRVIGTIDATGKQTLYVDGAAFICATAPGNFAATGSLTIGGSVGNNVFCTGPFGEFGVATGYSNATTVAALDTYLKDKWGL